MSKIFASDLKEKGGPVRTRQLLLIATLVGGAAALTACSEKTPDTSQQGSTNSTDSADPSDSCDGNSSLTCEQNGTTTPDAGTFDLCGAANTKIPAEYSTYVKNICNQISTLRSASVAYTGSGDPSIIESHSDSTSGSTPTTIMHVLSSLVVAEKPLSYYHMMQLQVTHPTDFQKVGFKVDNDINYTVQNSTATSADYEYVNNSEAPDAVVDYNATANFFEIKAGQAYAVATTLKQSKETVLSLKGLVLINGTGGKTEVFAASDQTYNNNNNPDSTASKAKKALVNQEKLDYGNGSMASKADSYFK